MSKILVVGKKSFIARWIHKQSKYHTILINYKDLIKKKDSFFKKFSFIINCSSNLTFVKKKYDIKFDHDYNIALKIKDLNCRYLFLSTRKVYYPKSNIKETDKLQPNCHYSKNKLISENKVMSVLNKRFLILRLGNIIGYDTNKSSRKLHITFMDIFIKNARNGIIFRNPHIYKDFLPIKFFVKIIDKLIVNKCVGIYNVSFGKKVYLDYILKWLNYYNIEPFKIKTLKINKKNNNKESFYLNINKLKRKIKFNLTIKILKTECMAISKKIFNEK